MPKVNKYTLADLKDMLVDFHNNHPHLGDTGEWYGDQARMTSNSVYEFIKWVEDGHYDGDIDNGYNFDDKSNCILGRLGKDG